MFRIHIIFLSLISIIFSQVSFTDINRISNQQLDLIKTELQSQDIANSDATPDNFQESESITVEAPEKTPKNNYFGYNYFERDINFFDNIPTPSDFKLGPGDEIVLSLWGETNSRESFLINKEGLIYYESIGFINLSNKTLKKLNQFY